MFLFSFCQLINTRGNPKDGGEISFSYYHTPAEHVESDLYLVLLEDSRE